jgi:hypothetical protein
MRVGSCVVREDFLLVRLISGPNRRFQFHKRSQLFIAAHDETDSSAAVRVLEQRTEVGRIPHTAFGTCV